MIQVSQDPLVGYRGTMIMDECCYFNPYRPGMSNEERLQVDEAIREASKEPTSIQRRIMELVRNSK